MEAPKANGAAPPAGGCAAPKPPKVAGAPGAAAEVAPNPPKAGAGAAAGGLLAPNPLKEDGAAALAALKPLGALAAGALPKPGVAPKGEGVGDAPKPPKLVLEAPGAPNDGICSEPLLLEAPVKGCGGAGLLPPISSEGEFMVMGELQAEFLRPGMVALVGEAGLAAPKVNVLGPVDGGFPAPNAGAAGAAPVGAPKVKGCAAVAPLAGALDPKLNGAAGAPDAPALVGGAPNVNGAAAAAGLESVAAASAGGAPNVNGAAAAGLKSAVAALAAVGAPNENAGAAEVAVVLGASVAVPLLAGGAPKAVGLALVEELMPNVAVDDDAAAGVLSAAAPKLKEVALRFFWLGSLVPASSVSSGCSDSFGLTAGAADDEVAAPKLNEAGAAVAPACGAGTGAAPKEKPAPVAVDAGAPKLVGVAFAAVSLAGDAADAPKEKPPLPAADGFESAEDARGFAASVDVEALLELPKEKPPPVVLTAGAIGDAFASVSSDADAAGAPNENPLPLMLPLVAVSFGAPKVNPPEPMLPPLPPVPAADGALGL